MWTASCTRQGYTYTITAFEVNGEIKMTMNDVASSVVWSDPQRKIHFAPYRMNDQNFWVILYGNKMYLTYGGDSMQREDFLRDYAARAYSPAVLALFALVLIIAPIVWICIMTYQMNPEASLFMNYVLLACGIFWLIYFNMLPVASTKKRRLFCFVSLMGPLCSALSFFVSAFM
ncbi:MAG: hypothetical protein IJW99_12335 [Clostridia bacterium]|nr:hypothetical protein [Clostridia bacterium]